MPRLPKEAVIETPAGATADVDSVATETVTPVAAPKAAKAKAPAAEESEFVVEDPEVMRPRSLPLIVRPTSGGWKNAEQEEFAKTLNGYAYKNPEKWAEKKETLLKQLSDLGKNPNLIVKLRGNASRVSFSDKAYGMNVQAR